MDQFERSRKMGVSNMNTSQRVTLDNSSSLNSDHNVQRRYMSAVPNRNGSKTNHKVMTAQPSHRSNPFQTVDPLGSIPEPMRDGGYSKTPKPQKIKFPKEHGEMRI